MKISLAITTYNRPDLTIKAFEKVLNDHRINDIVIVDDHSDYENHVALHNQLNRLENFKIGYYYNSENIGMQANKVRAISFAEMHWVLILDSDNQIDSSYLDALEKYAVNNTGLHSDEIYCPSAALPKFRYEENLILDKLNIRRVLKHRSIQCLMNTCNYVVHKATYLSTFKEKSDIGAADTIWHNYNHIKNGGCLVVVPGMHYNHKIHDDSGWRKDRLNNIGRFNEVIDLIKVL
jgi:glycosyltransferase involved in cell wall biosynthesis